MSSFDDSPTSIRVFLVDDHEVVRDGLRTLLDAQPDLEVVGEAGCVRDACDRILTVHADVAVVDLQLPDGLGSDIIRFARAKQPHLRCLVLTSFGHDELVFKAVAAGAAGYVLKNIRSQELLDCIRRVGSGEGLLDPMMQASVRRRSNSSEDSTLARLTPQERILLGHLADGLTNKEIAERMFLSDKTVKNYVSILLNKLGVTRRSAAAAMAARFDEERHRALELAHDRSGPIRY